MLHMTLPPVCCRSYSDSDLDATVSLRIRVDLPEKEQHGPGECHAEEAREVKYSVILP